VARYRYGIEDTLSPFQITFTDLSYYAPTSWHWNFGDGSSSQDTSPVHLYAQAGVYSVCLIVSNAFSADTFCQQVYVGITGTQSAPFVPQISISPNPFSSSVLLSLPARSAITPTWFLYDTYGRIILHIPLQEFETRVSLEHIPEGLYFWQLQQQGKWIQSGKIVKIPPR
jgi:PKD repeat protein